MKINTNKFRLNANITAYGNGDIICNITDKYGFINYTNKIVFTDELADGITVSGPPVILKGDNVTIKCLVDESMANALGSEISWYNQNSSDFKNASVISDDFTFIIGRRSSIIIKNITNIYNGNYTCGIRDKDGQIIGTTFSVTVYDKAVEDGYFFFAIILIVVSAIIFVGYTIVILNLRAAFPSCPVSQHLLPRRAPQSQPLYLQSGEGLAAAERPANVH